MEWTDFKVGQRIACGNYVCVVIEVAPEDQYVLYEIETSRGLAHPKDKHLVVYPENWRVLTEKPIDKFAYHMKRVEERHLRKATA